MRRYRKTGEREREEYCYNQLWRAKNDDNSVVSSGEIKGSYESKVCSRNSIVNSDEINRRNENKESSSNTGSEEEASYEAICSAVITGSE